jgi:TniQ
MSGRSLLYAQPLLGIGTGDVESLRSYIQRLAVSHNVKPRGLLEILLEAYPLVGIQHDLHTLLQRWGIHGTASIGLQLQERLQRATGVSVEVATLARFSRVLADVNLVRSRAREWFYCPCCVKEGDEPAHGRLLWEVQSVVACPKHRVRLRSTKLCGADAGEQLRPYQRPSMSGVCGHCGSVGFRCCVEAPEPASDAEVWVAEQVGRLLALPNETVTRVTKDSLQAGLVKLVESEYGTVVEASLQAGLPRASVWSWTKTSMRPALAGLMQLCHHAGCDVVALLEGKFIPLREVSAGVHKVVQRTYIRTTHTDDEIRQLLLLAATEEAPPTLSAFSRRLGLNEDAPRRRFPEEAQVLVAANSAYARAESQRKFDEALATYNAAAETLIDKGMPVGPKYLQQESRLVAFSQNEPRVRAMNTVIARYQSRMSTAVGQYANASNGQPATPRPL